jgi:pimeloyl-ACP methyl ester carboxylesterase
MTAALFVLVHGGGSTARYWDRVLVHLEESQQQVLAVDLPGRGNKPADLPTITVEDEVASVVADVRAALQENKQEQIVLVAHSSGGLVVPGVVAQLQADGDRVERILLNAALIPSEGMCGVDCLKPPQRDGLRVAVEQARLDGTAITLPGPPADPEVWRATYGGDPLTDDDLAFVVDPVRCVPDGVNHYFQPVYWSLVGDVPVTYALNERDRPISPAQQETMIASLPRPPSIVRLPGGHLPAVTDPAGFAAMVLGGAPRA